MVTKAIMKDVTMEMKERMSELVSWLVLLSPVNHNTGLGTNFNRSSSYSGMQVIKPQILQKT